MDKSNLCGIEIAVLTIISLTWAKNRYLKKISIFAEDKN